MSKKLKDRLRDPALLVTQPILRLFFTYLYVYAASVCEEILPLRRDATTASLRRQFSSFFPSLLRLRSMNCGVFRRTQWNEHKARFVNSSLLSDSKRASALFCSNAFPPLSRERPIKLEPRGRSGRAVLGPR